MKISDKLKFEWKKAIAPAVLGLVASLIGFWVTREPAETDEANLVVDGIQVQQVQIVQLDIPRRAKSFLYQDSFPMDPKIDKALHDHVESFREQLVKRACSPKATNALISKIKQVMDNLIFQEGKHNFNSEAFMAETLIDSKRLQYKEKLDSLLTEIQNCKVVTQPGLRLRIAVHNEGSKSGHIYPNLTFEVQGLKTKYVRVDSSGAISIGAVCVELDQSEVSLEFVPDQVNIESLNQWDSLILERLSSGKPCLMVLHWGSGAEQSKVSCENVRMNSN